MTIKFSNVYLGDAYTFIGKNEHKLTITGDESVNDYYMGKKSFEEGEVEYQKRSISGLIKKEKDKKIDLLIGADLQNQLLASNFASRNYNYPFLGIYSACASYAEGLIIASSLIEQKLKNVVVTVSANNLASEKQFRFPIEYGAIRKNVNTFTVSASISSLVTSAKTKIKIESATIGNVVDIGYSDTNNMGAVMAPSAHQTIVKHLKDTKRKPDYYDFVLTGDLGVYGVNILKELLEKEDNITLKNVLDAGTLIFEDSGSSIAGGSGPVCLPLILNNKILKNKTIKKILIVATGSLHSKVSSNLGESVPSISHAVSLEVMKK